MNEYNGYSDEELDNRLTSLRREISLIEDEKIARKIQEKKIEWEVLVRAVETYCAKYGAIEICSTAKETYCVLTDDSIQAERPGCIVV